MDGWMGGAAIHTRPFLCHVFSKWKNVATIYLTNEIIAPDDSPFSKVIIQMGEVRS